MEDDVSTVAKAVIEKCGGIKVVMGICGVSRNAVYKWTYPKDRGGTGGIVPHYAAELLLANAKSGGVNVRPEDFFETKLEAA